ncbi:MAG: hypothetical protein ABII18_06565, partial [bacterium]
MKLKNIIISIALPLVIISITIIEFTTLYYYKKNVLDHLEVEITENFTTLKEVANQFLESSQNNLVLFGSFEVFRKYNKYIQYGLAEEAFVVSNEIKSSLKRLVSLKDEYVAIGYVADSNKLISSYSKTQVHISDWFSSSELVPTSKKNIFLYKNKNIGKQNIIRIVHKMEPGATGYLYLDIDIYKLLDRLKFLYVSSKLEAYFTDKQGSILYLSDNQYHEKINNYNKDKSTVRIISNELRDYDEHLLISNLYPLDEFDWFIGFVVKKELVFGTLTRLKFYGLLIIAIASALLLVIISLLTNKISKPVENILDDIVAISTGDYYQKKSPSNLIVKEYRLIGSALNKMKQRLTVMQKKTLEQTTLASIGETASQIAHDIRSPLAALNMVTHDLKQLPEDERIIIRSAVQRIQDIANDLASKKDQSFDKTQDIK